MGYVIQLPIAPTEYPDVATDLDPAERVLLTAIRWWVADFKVHADPLPRLCHAMTTAGAHDAAFSVDQLMAILAGSAQHPIEIHYPRCPGLSQDEKHLLNAASLAQAGESRMAERALRTALLSAPGADCAIGPLQGLGTLFAKVKMRLRRRIQPVMDQAPAPRTIH